MIEIDFLKEKAIYLDGKQSRLVTYWMTLAFQIVIHRQNLFNKYFGYQSTTQLITVKTPVDTMPV